MAQAAGDVSGVRVAGHVVLGSVHSAVSTQDGRVVVHRKCRHAQSVCACAGVGGVSAPSVAFCESESKECF